MFKDNGGLFDAQKLTHGLVCGGLVARNVPMPAGIAQQVGGKGQAPCRRSALPIENAGDDLVRVASCQTAQERQGLFIGANGGRARARQMDIQFGQSAPAPAQGQMSPVVVTENGDDDFFHQAAQEFLLVAGRGRGGEPDALEILAERPQRLLLASGQCGRALLLTTGQFGPGLINFS